MMKTTSLIAVAMAACIHSAAATTIGLSTGPISTTWDTFTAVTFTGDAPDTTTSHITATLSSAMVGGTITGSGDRLYAGQRGTPNAFDLSITGTSTIPLVDVGLLLKFTAPSVGTSQDYFSVALNGQAPTSVTFLSSFVDAGQTFSVYQWSWAGAPVSGSAINLSINGAADHVSVDAIQLVPEPGSAALGLVGVTLLALRRRKA